MLGVSIRCFFPEGAAVLDDVKGPLPWDDPDLHGLLRSRAKRESDFTVCDRMVLGKKPGWYRQHPAPRPDLFDCEAAVAGGQAALDLVAVRELDHHTRKPVFHFQATL